MINGKTPIHPSLEPRSNLLKALSVHPKMPFVAKTAAAGRAWQKKARAAFEETLGDPLGSVPLKKKVLEKVTLDGYDRTMFLLDTAPGIKALCWLIEPHKRFVSKGKNPAVIATPGHGYGAKSFLALDEAGKARKEGEGYQKDYALQAMRLGYTVLAIEPMGFGERRDAKVMAAGIGTDCLTPFSIALMAGTSLQRIRLNDLSRGYDFLASLKHVDPDRIAIIGISGGGQMALYTAAADTRFKASIVSGYINTHIDSVLGIHHCICNFGPKIAGVLDMPDIAALCAPRPMLVESGTKDDIFPIKASIGAFEKIKKAYGVFGAGDRVEHDVFEGEHQWSGTHVEAFFRKWL